MEERLPRLQVEEHLYYDSNTGLYGYKRRKITVVRCDGCTKILVGTMGETDGAGNIQGT